jgi:methylglutaconyl-CoA hydratase
MLAQLAVPPAAGCDTIHDMSDELLVSRDGPLLMLTLNDPQRANPLSPAMVAALQAALTGPATAAGVRAVVLAGSGRHFSAGADLEALESIAEGGDPDAIRADTERLGELYAGLLALPRLTVAAVHGAAIGGGCGLATACDLVVAEQRARFAYTEVTIGFIPALVSTFLNRRVAGHVARRLMLDPEILDGERAVEVGLADELVEDGRALEAAVELARSVARKASPSALAATKTLLNQTVGMGWREALAGAAAANVSQREHPECRHGVRFFLEHKATPDWLDHEPED